MRVKDENCIATETDDWKVKFFIDLHPISFELLQEKMRDGGSTPVTLTWFDEEAFGGWMSEVYHLHIEIIGMCSSNAATVLAYYGGSSVDTAEAYMFGYCLFTESDDVNRPDYGPYGYFELEDTLVAALDRLKATYMPVPESVSAGVEPLRPQLAEDVGESVGCEPDLPRP